MIDLQANTTPCSLDDRNLTNLLNITTEFPPPLYGSEDLLFMETCGGATNNDANIQIIAKTVVPIFFGLIFCTGLVGNALVVLVILSNRNMRSTTNLLIINLAVADLLFVVFCIPFTATDYVLDRWPFGNIWCKTVQYLIVVTANASIYTLVLMSLDRFLAVVYPIASRAWRTERNTSRACLLIWIVTLTAALPAWFAHGELVSAR